MLVAFAFLLFQSFCWQNQRLPKIRPTITKSKDWIAIPVADWNVIPEIVGVYGSYTYLYVS